MRIASKPVLLTVPVVMFIALVAVLALWATGSIGGSGGPGASSTASIVWNVEYWHKNAAGEVLQYQKKHNTVLDEGVQAAMERIVDVSVTTSGAADTFDNIVLLGNAVSVSAINGGSTNIILGSDILDFVDGLAGDTAPVAGGVYMNPATGTFTDDGSEDGKGSVQVAFLGETDGNDSVTGPANAVQMLLVKAPPFDNIGNGGETINADEILAAITISVNLAETDTLTVTWTLDLNAT